MPTKIMVSLAVASVAIRTSALHAAGFADNVIGYSTGTGFAQGYANPNAALGEPSRITPGPFGGAVDPFNPPYLAEQVVSIGTGGSLTLGFGSPILDNPDNRFGIDFIIFGNTGFQITNGDFSGGGITDGSLFGSNNGSTRVSVSSDGVAFFELTPSQAPVVDGLFPTDGSGDFTLAVNPALNGSSFAGKDLAGIRQLYQGS